MIALVRLPASRLSGNATAGLIADYLAYDRKRRAARPYLNLFSGLAVVTLLGGALHRVPRMESIEAASVMAVPACGLLLLDAWRRSRLHHRLHALQASLHDANP